MSRTIIFANGSIAEIEPIRDLLQPEDTIIAANGGTRHVLALGLVPSVIVGDLDSLTPAEREKAQGSNCKIVQYPRDKNETDLELALRFATETHSTQIVIVGALGGRLDQTLGNLSLLTRPEYAGLDVHLEDGTEAAWFVRKELEIHGKPGDIVSLLPWGQAVGGVTTKGLRWPLYDETLFPDETRGISNELVDSSGRISIKSGLLLVILRRARKT